MGANASQDASRLDGCAASPQIQATARELLPLLHAEVRRIARRERRRVGAGETLRTTALVHEAWLKLDRSSPFADEGHFLRAAALAMRHVLVNHALAARTAKRGSGVDDVPLEEAEGVAMEAPAALLAVHAALQRLAMIDARLADVVECRFFGGFDASETARALGITERTVARDWVKARAWLHKELREHGDEAIGG